MSKYASHVSKKKPLDKEVIIRGIKKFLWDSSVLDKFINFQCFLENIYIFPHQR